MQPGLFAVNLRGTPDQISPRQQLLGSIISKMLCKVILDIFRVGGKRGYLKKKRLFPQRALSLSQFLRQVIEKKILKMVNQNKSVIMSTTEDLFEYILEVCRKKKKKLVMMKMVDYQHAHYDGSLESFHQLSYHLKYWDVQKLRNTWPQAWEPAQPSLKDPLPSVQPRWTVVCCDLVML